MMRPDASLHGVDTLALRTRLGLGLALLLVIAACTGGGSGPTATSTAAPTATGEPTAGTIAVPDIVDETEQDGMVELGAAGLTAGDRTRAYSDEFDPGRIISTDPRAGVIVAQGTEVDYVLSRGAEPTPSPTPRKTTRPTAKPTVKPTAKPTARPTARPTATPTATPTEAPTALSTLQPTSAPTTAPTEAPPTSAPTAAPIATPAPVEVPLPETAWILATAVEDASTDVELPDGLTFTADFSETHVSGTVVCNQFSAPYTVADGGLISIGEVAVTAMACPDDDGTAQTTYIGALQASTSYSTTATRLQLTADDGTRLVYSPAPPSSSPSASPTE
jgi:heat shock protein HslJ